jgi:hypothetical protein
LTYDAAKIGRTERSAFEVAGESGPTIRDANDLVAVAQRHFANCSNRRVQPRRVTSRG